MTLRRFVLDSCHGWCHLKKAEKVTDHFKSAEISKQCKWMCFEVYISSLLCTTSIRLLVAFTREACEKRDPTVFAKHTQTCIVSRYEGGCNLISVGRIRRRRRRRHILIRDHDGAVCWIAAPVLLFLLSSSKQPVLVLLIQHHEAMCLCSNVCLVDATEYIFQN